MKPRESRRLAAERPPGVLPSLVSASLALVLIGCGPGPTPAEKSNPTALTNPPTATPAAPANDAAQIIARLAGINLTNGPLTTAHANAWKEDLARLAAAGPAALPVLGDFFARNVDLGIESAGYGALLGHPTLRLGLLEVVEKIGGPDALALAQKVFATTADPAELVALARLIEKVEPGKHHAEFAAAAKETLALAATGNWDGRDVAPLYELLRNFGSTNDVAELERHANRWFAYTAITLARWPGGAGESTLIKLVENVGGQATLGRDFYFRMLADVAIHSPRAADALVGLVKGNSIGVDSWPGLGRTLSGYALHLPDHGLSREPGRIPARGPGTYHLSFGNQNYAELPLPADRPTKEIGARINLIDRLLESTTNPAAIDAFEAARVTLSVRLPRAK